MALKLLPSCFILEYLVTFMSLLLLANLSSYFGSIVSFVGQLLVLSVISWHSFKTISQLVNKKFINPNKRAVIITGCDTGFGNATALKLNGQGFRVYATVLDPESNGSKDLMSEAPFPHRITVMKMDVTNDEDVSAVYQQIKSDLLNNEEELWAVVNNAGIAVIAPLDWGTIDDYHRVFEVNTFGTVRVTRAFLPLIRKSKGHIVNVASAFGRFTFPDFSIYAMSKHSVISFSDALRRENRNWSLCVSTIEPMGYQTNINRNDLLRNSLDHMWNNTSDVIKQDYGQQFYEKLRAHSIAFAPNLKGSSDISQVVNSIVDAVQNQEPKISYLVASNLSEKIGAKLLEFFPTEISDYLISAIRIT